MDQGKVVEVSISYSGASVTQAQNVGDSILNVDDATDFDEAGGQVQIGALTYAYLGIDDLANTLTLASALTVAMEEGDPVYLFPLSEEKWATVDIPSQEDSVSARIPHGLAAQFDEGIRDVYDQESVWMYIGPDDNWTIADVSAQTPSVGGEYIDVTTLPPTGSDGLPPAYAPSIAVIGGVGSLAVRLEPITNGTPVVYQYFISTSPGFPLDSTTLVHTGPEASYSIRTLADGTTALVPGTVYFVAANAVDESGVGPVSSVVAAQTVQITSADIAANQGWFGFMAVDQLTGGTLSADVLLSAYIRTAIAGARVEHGPDGSTWYNSNGDPVIVLPSNISDLIPAIFKGRGEFQELTANNGIKMLGASELAKGSSMQVSSKLTPPPTAPTPTQDWETLALSGSFVPPVGSVNGLQWDATANEWLVAYTNPANQDSYMLRYDASGVYIGVSGPIISGAQTNYGRVRIGTRHIVLRSDSAGTYWYLYDSTTGFFAQYPRMNTTQVPVISTDGTYLYVAESDPRSPRFGKFGVSKWDPNAAKGSNLVPNGDFETDVSGWIAGANTTISRSTTVGGATGAAAMRMVATAAGQVQAYTNPGSAISVFPGQRVGVQAAFRTASQVRPAYVTLEFQDGSGNTLSNTASYISNDSTTWTDYIGAITGTVPQGAVSAKVGVVVQNCAAGEIHYVDKVQVYTQPGMAMQGTGGVYPSTTDTFSGPLGALAVSAFDLPGTRYLIMPTAGTMNWLEDTTGTYNKDENFDSVPVAPKGAAWNGVNIFTLGNDTILYKHTSTTWDSSRASAAVVGTTYQDTDATGGTHETALGAVANVALKKRARLTLTSGALPTGTGTDDPNGFGFYLCRPLQINVNNKALTTNIATLTTAVAHGLVVGDTVTVLNVGSPFDGTWKVKTVPTSTTFTYSRTASNVTSSGSFGNMYKSVVPRTDMLYQGSAAPLPGSTNANILLNPPQFVTGLTDAITALTVPSDPATAHAWDFPGATPAVLFSQALDLGLINPNWKFSGDGSWKLGALSGDAAGNVNLDDTGWVSFTIANSPDVPWGSVSVNYAEYRRIGRMVTVRISKTSGSAYTGSASGNFGNIDLGPAGSLPAAVRPTRTTPMSGSWNDMVINVVITSLGTFTIIGGQPNGAYAASSVLYAIATYMLD